MIFFGSLFGDPALTRMFGIAGVLLVLASLAGWILSPRRRFVTEVIQSAGAVWSGGRRSGFGGGRTPPSSRDRTIEWVAVGNVTQYDPGRRVMPPVGT